MAQNSCSPRSDSAASWTRGCSVYFVHSYYPQPANKENMFAVSDYGGEFCCAVGKKNYFAVQFHPEKSGRLGLQMLQRFAKWDGKVPPKSEKRGKQVC